MKKLLLTAFLVCSSLALAATPIRRTVGQKKVQTLESSYAALENEFQALMEKENQYFISKQGGAANAQAKLAEYEAMHNEITNKIEQLEANKNSKFYKSDYAGLVTNLNQVKKQIEGEIRSQQQVIENFEKLQQLRGGY